MRKFGLFIAVVAIAVAPMSVLLLFPHAVFSDDWRNNLWMVGYQRVYFVSHFGFPPVYNVAGYVGIPQPIYYGPLLYPWLAVLSGPLGVDLGIRAACVAVWGLQCWLVFRLSRVVGAGRVEAIAAAAVTSWSVYALTNLYARGAVAEFFGTAFLQCAVAAGGLALAQPLPSRRIAHAFLAALCAAMALASHTPTALVGGAMLMVLSLAALPWRARREAPVIRKRLGVTLLFAAIIVVILSPFLDALTQTSGPLTISAPNPYYNIGGKWTRLESVDSWWARLSPLPIPPQWMGGVEQGPTAHLDGQWNFALAMLAGWACATVLIRRRGRARRDAWPLLIASGVIAAMLLALSISQTFQDVMPQKVAAAIQFPYRLVSGVNIAMLAMLMTAWSMRGRPAPSSKPSGSAVMVFAVLLAAVGLEMKLKFAATALPDDAASTAPVEDRLDELPPTFVGQHDYTVQIPARAAGEYAENHGVRMAVPTGAGPLEDVQDATADFAIPTWVVTGVLNYPWNRLVLDGTPVPFDEVRNLFFHQAVLVSTGTHRFGYQFEPAPAWTVLRYASWATLLLMAAATGLCWFRRGI